MSKAQPNSFEIVEQDGTKVASNGQTRVVLLDEGGRLFRRRGIRGIRSASGGEAVLRELNGLAGDLLARLDMPKEELTRRLEMIREIANPPEPQRVEWAVAELNGVRVYVDGESVVVTTQDLNP